MHLRVTEFLPTALFLCVSCSGKRESNAVMHAAWRAKQSVTVVATLTRCFCQPQSCTGLNTQCYIIQEAAGDMYELECKFKGACVFFTENTNVLSGILTLNSLMMVKLILLLLLWLLLLPSVWSVHTLHPTLEFSLYRIREDLSNTVSLDVWLLSLEPGNAADMWF